MFTGIIQDLGRVESIARASGGARLTVAPEAPFSDLGVGESVAVEGACLTAEEGSTPDRLGFFLTDETLAKTTLGRLAVGATVNLERSLRAGDRIGGHWVTGHVDGVGVIRRFDSDGESRLLEIGQCGALQPYLAPKGSICVDGISLTVVQATPQGFTVAVVPHTLEATSLRAKRAGAEVNLEADLIARYVVNYLKATGKAPNARAFELAGWE